MTKYIQDRDQEKPSNLVLGKFGEHKASEFLQNRGFTITHRNYKNRFGEIDIICKKEKTIYFVEVKARSSIRYGLPVEAVGYRKLNKIKNAINVYLKENNIKNAIIEILIISIIKNRKTINIKLYTLE